MLPGRRKKGRPQWKLVIVVKGDNQMVDVTE